MSDPGDAGSLRAQLARKSEELRLLRAISTQINATLDLARIFEVILSSMDAVFGFAHSMILTSDDQTLRVVASHGYGGSGVGATVEVGRGVIGMVAKKRRSMRLLGVSARTMYASATRREAQAEGQEVEAAVVLPGLPGAGSQLAIPLVAKGRLIGVYAVESVDPAAFDAVDEELCSVVGQQLAIAIDNAEAYAAQARLTQAYGRFVPHEFLALLGRQSILDVALGDHVDREMTILFADVRGFTRLSERMTPKEAFAFVNGFLAMVAPVIREHGGFIDKYIGDAIMALFPGDPDDALAAAVEMQRRVAAHGIAEIGVGLHTGPLTLGVVGFADRTEGTVIGDSVNLAARLQDATKELGAPIVVSEASVARLARPESFALTALGAVAVKGKAEAVRVYGIPVRP